MQVDSHLAELTVKETMDFSARRAGPRHQARCSPFSTREGRCILWLCERQAASVTHSNVSRLCYRAHLACYGVPSLRS